MATARAIFQAHVDGLLPESIPFDLQWVFPSTPFQLQTITLASGDTVLTIPTGTTLIVLSPPVTNVATVTIKGSGFVAQPDTPLLLSYTSGTVTITAGGTIAGVVLAYF